MSDPVPPRQSPEDPWRSEGAPPRNPERPQRRGRGWGGMVLTAPAVFVVTDIILSLFTGTNSPTISCTEFDRQLSANNISKPYSKGDAIEGQLKKAQKMPGGDGEGTYTPLRAPARVPGRQRAGADGHSAVTCPRRGRL